MTTKTMMKYNNNSSTTLKTMKKNETKCWGGTNREDSQSKLCFSQD